MIHKHHIIPKHMNGTDEPENIIELTVEEHAEAHRVLYEKYGKIEDYLAWQGLSKMITKQEIIKIMISEGGKKGGKSRSKETNSRVAKIRASKNWEKNKEKILITLKKNSEASRLMKKETGRGPGGPPKGKWIWITNGKENKKIEKTETIPEDWKRGRTKFWKTGICTKPKERVICPHCNKEGGKPAMMNFHFDKCKYK